MTVGAEDEYRRLYTRTRRTAIVLLLVLIPLTVLTVVIGLWLAVSALFPPM